MFKAEPTKVESRLATLKNRDSVLDLSKGRKLAPLGASASKPTLVRVELVAQDPREGGNFSGGKKKGGVKVMQVPIESPQLLPYVGRANTPDGSKETTAQAQRDVSGRERLAFQYTSPKREAEAPSVGKKKKTGALHLHPLPLKNIKVLGKRRIFLNYSIEAATLSGCVQVTS